jgi:hypothetical protein
MQGATGGDGRNCSGKVHHPTSTSETHPKPSGNVPRHRPRQPTSSIVIPGYPPLSRFMPYTASTQAQASVQTLDQLASISASTASISASTTSTPSRIFQHPTVLRDAPPTSREVAPTPSSTSAPPQLSRPTLSDSERDTISGGGSNVLMRDRTFGRW